MAFVPPPNDAGVILPVNPQYPPTLGDITNSKEYVERLANSKRVGIPGATATDNNIGAAERYHQDIILTNTIMGPAPPQWLVQFGAAPPQWLGQVIGNVQESLLRVEARQVNARISRLNKLEIDGNTGVVAYRAKQKEIAGDGTALANNLLVHGIGPLAPLQAVPAVGTAIGATINFNNLTHHGILRLIQFYNNDFGIQPDELLPGRTQRVLNWLVLDV